MIIDSPYPSSEGSGKSSDLKGLSQADLLARAEELEETIETMRRRHQIELRRGLEGGGNSAPNHALGTGSPTHSHPDGYDAITYQRVAVLIDVQNMYYAARNLYNSKLEFSKLLTTLVRGRILTRAIAYIVERPGMEQEKFVEVLRRNGYEVRKKILIERSDGSQKGDWDLGIALDAIALSDKVDVVVLVTGDGDFVTLVHFLSHRGLRVEVASFPETTALELIRSSVYYHRLNERVLLPGGQFQAPERRESDSPDDDDHDEEELEPAATTGGRRPGRSPIDDLDLDDEDDDFSL